VHGVRALALAAPGARAGHGGAAEGAALAARPHRRGAGARPAGCTALPDGLRLSHQLRQRAGGAQPGNEVRPSELGTLEREPLHDALAIVKRFRGFLRQHFGSTACDLHAASMQPRRASAAGAVCVGWLLFDFPLLQLWAQRPAGSSSRCGRC
jgi:hypothetical protein